MRIQSSNKERISNAGFSFLELLIAMTITLAVLVAAATLLTSSLRIRSRENLRADALTATQRALNVMSREIANSGYGLADNGIVATDSGQTSIRVRANLNNNDTIAETDEDIRYQFQSANSAIVRYDNFPEPTGSSVVIASNITGLTIRYFDASGTQINSSANYDDAVRVQLEMSVSLPAAPEQPASTVQLQSDVALRNAESNLDQF